MSPKVIGKHFQSFGGDSQCMSCIKCTTPTQLQVHPVVSGMGNTRQGFTKEHLRATKHLDGAQKVLDASNIR
jgi:hypothetical protein